MLKHIGKHSGENVIIDFREVPNEDHMCLVVYPGQVPSVFHDDLMKCVESNAGQAASNFGEAAHRVVGTDGRILLEAIHNQKWMKKVRCQDVIMTPLPNQQGARLDEINKIIAEMESGADAARRMAEIDAQAGLADPAKALPADSAYAATSNTIEATQVAEGVLTDEKLAQDMIKQAEGFKAQVIGLQAEHDRLMAEAVAMNPSLAPAPEAPRKRGRPKKVVAADPAPVTTVSS
jgi:hypothetical protein